MLEIFFSTIIEIYFLRCYKALSYLSRDTEINYLQPILNHFWRGRVRIVLKLSLYIYIYSLPIV